MPVFSPPITLTYSINGIEHNLTHGNDGLYGLPIYYLGDSNFGLPPINHYIQQGALQQGDTYLGYQTQARIINLPLFLPATTINEHYIYRESLIRIFGSTDTKGVLKVYFSEGNVRAIDCHTLGGLTFDIVPEEGYAIRTIVQLRCDNPIWYNPATETWLIESDPEGGDPTAYPVSYPMGYGGPSMSYGTFASYYSGTFYTYPIITVYGPITDGTLLNPDTGQFIRIKGTIEEGDYLVFDLRYGYKTVVDSVGSNAYPRIDSSSNLATFAFAGKPQTSIDTIRINIGGTDIGATTAVLITYNVAYQGI